MALPRRRHRLPRRWACFVIGADGNRRTEVGEGITERQVRLFGKIVRLGVASMYACRHNRNRIHHVNQRAVYAAVGEPDSGLRRRLTLNRAIQRLMVLDVIAEDPDLVWLATAEDKAAHPLAITSIALPDLPHAVVGVGDGRKVRPFSDRLEPHSSRRPRRPRLRTQRAWAERLPRVPRAPRCRVTCPARENTASRPSAELAEHWRPLGRLWSST